MKKIFFALLFSTYIIGAYAQSFESGELKYNVVGDNSVEVAGFTYSNKNNTHVTIPSTVSNGGKKYTVERIGEYAFPDWAAKGLVSVVLPSTIKSIGKSAFWESKIESIKLPIGLERIEDYAFQKCSSLKYVYFPPSPLELGDLCFSDCDNLIRQEGFHPGIKSYGYNPFSSSPIV